MSSYGAWLNPVELEIESFLSGNKQSGGVRFGSSRSAVSRVSAVAIVVILVIVAGVAGYYYVASTSSSSPSATSSSSSSTSSIASTPSSSSTTTASTVSSSTATATSPTSSLASTSAASNFNTVINAAQQEGSVNVYTSLTTTAIQAIITDFNQQYPSIKVTPYSGSANAVLSKVQTEASGGINNVDVISANLVDVVPLNQSGLLAPFSPPEAANVSSSDRFGSNICYGTTQYTVALLYNTKLVNPSSLPSSWLALVQNKSWTGKIGMGDPTLHFTTGQWLLALEPIFGNGTWTAFIHQLAALNPRFYPSMTPGASGVSLGDVQIGIGLASDANTLAQQGGPISAKFLQPILKFESYTCVAAKAPHPNAAILFANYMMSQKGEQAEANIGDQMVRPDVNSSFASQLSGQNVTVFGQQTLAQVTAAENSVFKPVFSGG